jgi:hypothetical protein
MRCYSCQLETTYAGHRDAYFYCDKYMDIVWINGDMAADQSNGVMLPYDMRILSGDTAQTR